MQVIIQIWKLCFARWLRFSPAQKRSYHPLVITQASTRGIFCTICFYTIFFFFPIYHCACYSFNSHSQTPNQHMTRLFCIIYTPAFTYMGDLILLKDCEFRFASSTIRTWYNYTGVRIRFWQKTGSGVFPSNEGRFLKILLNENFRFYFIL